MRDVRLALRALRSTPLVSALAALSLALGIGANSAVFSLINSLLLRTLPVSNPQRLVTVSSDFALAHGYRNGIGWNYDMWRRFQQDASAFEDGFAWTWAAFNLSPRGQVDRVRGMIASGSFFSTLGVPALIGRTFTAADDVRGGGPDGPVAVISYALWQRRFGGDTSVVGRPLEIDHVPFTIVGVTPAEFSGIEVGESLDVVVPLGTDPLLKGTRTLLDNPAALLLTVMLRLKPEQSLESATAAIRAMQPRILDMGRSQLPKFAREAFVLVPAATGSTDKSQLRQRYEQPLFVIAAVTMLVLLIACVNIANLELARAAARRHEFSVRLALGAPRARLAWQLFLESLIIASAGAVLGLQFATWSSRLLVSQLSTSGDPVFLNLPIDWRVLGFTATVAVATALLFGTVPAFRASRVSPFDVMKTQGRGGPGLQRRNISSSLVVVQVAFSLVVICAAGLFLETFQRLDSEPIGFDANRMLVVTVDTSRATVTPKDRDQFSNRLVRTVAAVPGVSQAAASMATPGPGGGANLLTDARGRAVDLGRRVMMNAVTPGWFATYGVPLRAGRDVADADTAQAPPVAVVNVTFARVFFGGRSPIGSVFDDTSTNTRRTIVGMVGDVVYGSRRDTIIPTAYIPLAQSAGLGPGVARTSLQISIRAASGSPAPVIREIGTALGDVDPELSYTVRVVDDRVRAALAQERLVAVLSSFFGVLAALLAGLGLYGLTSYGISRREMEIGVRLALGSSTASILRLVISQTISLVAMGILIGVGASLWLSHFVAALLYGVGPRDPTTILSAAAALMTLALIAAWLPARRAILINPADLLRRT
jgi:putative ABC transport system permease protein